MTWKYTGGGQGYYLPGVPARDLSEAEWRDLDATTRERAKALEMYEHVQDKPAKAEAKVRAEAEPEAPAAGAEEAK